ncbi:ABC transporter substrate-binding protein [Bifidobacterium phasiani]|uniref:Extracellular solute-binding protein n=1 Tax=Bifidobacterium phasiani TaxID=2834431 RepID=A0ABS6WCQ8_9BIFI|nr:extracellular solute-binding protein [Bifidobacterium phasiani]MBW3083506.1 extracellular solute-binding protein [Bifidobacterium phasiani]
MESSRFSRTLAAGAAIVAAVSLAACGGTGGSAGVDDKVIEFWDPYPQYAEGSDWHEWVVDCAPEGYTIKRQGMPQNDVLNSLTTAVKADNAPDVAVLDNPFMPTAVDSGLVTDLATAGVDVDGFDENIEGPGIVDGVQYGLAFGSNALGLYYNPEVLDSAGVDPASITDWDSLNAAIGKVVDSGAKGITFSGITGEEGVFQFLPWFWGAGGDLSEPESQAAEDAQALVSGWIRNGWAPKSATTDNQSASWDLMLTGEYGFAENGSWQAAAAREHGFGMIPIPAKDGGVAPVATGGEFATLPYHKTANAEKTEAAASVITCLTSGENLARTNETIGYLAATKTARETQVRENGLWAPWVESVEGARGRTTDVGLEYETISATLSENLQAALNS